jgi:hypothetical protein
MKIYFIIYLLILSFQANAKCNNSPSFIDSEKKVQTAAAVHFRCSDGKLLFKPVLCLNRENSGEIDFSKYPSFKEICKAPTQRFRVIDVINSTDETFEKAITAQESYIDDGGEKSRLGIVKRLILKLSGGDECIRNVDRNGTKPRGFVSWYALTNGSEDFCETLSALVVSGYKPKGTIHFGDWVLSKDRKLQIKLERILKYLLQA